MDDSLLKIGEPNADAFREIEPRFYYSREDRLKTAPENVKRMYSQRPEKYGFLRSLTDTKPKLMLLATIVVLCAVIIVLRYAG
jgi:hypothetical protein